MAPLIAERTLPSRFANGDGGAIAHRHNLVGRRRAAAQHRRIGAANAVKAKVVDSEVPAPGSDLGETEANGRLIVSLCHTDYFDTFGCSLIVIRPRTDVRAKPCPLALRHANVLAIVTVS